MSSNDSQIRFWNGNKSPIRREHETQLLRLCLAQAGIIDAQIVVDETDYPNAEDEGNIFANNCDVLVSVAGNQKFLGKQCIILKTPLCRGILGNRLLVIRKSSAERFAAINSIEMLKQMTIGVPDTWADADVFRQNGFNVIERGNLDDIFERLKEQEFDFFALGANEIESTFHSSKHSTSDLMIEPSILLYYPLPLLFYVNPERSDLADTIENGLKTAIENGSHLSLFEAHHPNLCDRLALKTRKTFLMSNPYLPTSLQGFRPSL